MSLDTSPATAAVVERGGGRQAEAARGELPMRLVERLRSRRGELAQSILARVSAVSDPRETGRHDYEFRLREAVFAALDFGLATIAGDASRRATPAVLLEQARGAARSGVSVDTVLRCYLAGHTLLCDQVLLEAERHGCSSDRALRRILRAQSTQLDLVLAAVTQAYTAEVATRHGTQERRRAELVRRLLDGELVEASELGYDLDCWHLGVVAGGPFARRAIRELATLLDRRLLLALPGGEIVWGWLGGRRPVRSLEIEECSVPSLAGGQGVSLAVGEPASGVEGLRLTHRQAKAAFPLATQGKAGLVRYADHAVVASVWGDWVLARSLNRVFLEPLTSGRDGDTTLLQTLLAYFGAGRNAASAAAGLGVSRQTVNVRLRTIEEKIGRPLDGCGPELETALRMWELGHPTALPVTPA